MSESRPESTCWTDLAAANDLAAPGPVREAALDRLVRRYEDLVRRFLGWRFKQAGLSGQAQSEAVEECFQRFALKPCEGAFQSADRERRRFSPYIKTVLSNLAVDYLRNSSRPSAEVEDVAEQEKFDHLYRDGLVARALERLKETGPQFYPPLRLRLDQPDWSAEQMAAALSTPEQPRSVDWVKQQLHRGRERLKALLRLEVAYEIGSHLSADVDEELGRLGLGDQRGG